MTYDLRIHLEQETRKKQMLFTGVTPVRTKGYGSSRALKLLFILEQSSLGHLQALSFKRQLDTFGTHLARSAKQFLSPITIEGVFNSRNSRLPWPTPPFSANMELRAMPRDRSLTDAGFRIAGTAGFELLWVDHPLSCVCSICQERETKSYIAFLTFLCNFRTKSLEGREECCPSDCLIPARRIHD